MVQIYTPQEILDFPLESNDANARTIREYLLSLLGELWADKEIFSAKRPFGNSEWELDIYYALADNHAVEGYVDEDGDLADFDIEHADELIANAICALN